jgi:hypothetical protein
VRRPGLLALDMGSSLGWGRRRDGFVSSGQERLALPEDEGRALCFRHGLRLRRFGLWLDDALSGIQFVAFEEPVIFPGRPRGTQAAYQFQGVLLERLAARGIAHASVDPTHLKKFATGNSRAEKADMQRAAIQRHGLGVSGALLGEDQADALCVLTWAEDELGV